MIRHSRKLASARTSARWRTLARTSTTQTMQMVFVHRLLFFYVEKLLQFFVYFYEEPNVRWRRNRAVEFVHGCGKRKSQMQKLIGTLEEYIGKRREYNILLSV